MQRSTQVAAAQARTRAGRPFQKLVLLSRLSGLSQSSWSCSSARAADAPR